MEGATTDEAEGMRPRASWLLGLAPTGCLVLTGWLWFAGLVLARADRGDLDLRLSAYALGPALMAKVDRGGPPQAPHRLMLVVDPGIGGFGQVAAY